MNAVEIEEAISSLAEQPFVPAEFPYAFLEAFGNKETTIQRLKSGNNNKSDIDGAVLQQNNIHIAVCVGTSVADTLKRLKESPATIKGKAKFILATDGKEFQAEDLSSGETVVCSYLDFHNHFGFFLPLAGISTVKQIRENAFDIKATSRLNKLYIELLNHNPEWSTAAKRHDMNHFLARLIFCFFAEDTDIFVGEGFFTETVRQMSAGDGSDVHEIIGEIFRAMDIKQNERVLKKVRNWASKFPYVNGNLFSGSTETPKFTKIARSYLLHVGNLDWKRINPDIFGSMIQAVADADERGALGMHYTSVPNILKVLNPLFLDELYEELEQAGDNGRKLLTLRKRLARIRVFDPACGSGNFLVIAYKQLREIEFEINIRRGESNTPSEIPLTNFRGIELRDFSAEIARLALIIAEYQCDVLYRGQKLALAEFLPLDSENWITSGNSLQIDWLLICPPSGVGVRLQGDDLFSTPVDQAEIKFENEGGETYICGNPPYLGGKGQSISQKSELSDVFGEKGNIGELDYVSGWVLKGAKYIAYGSAKVAFVVTNSINQGAQVHQLWPKIYKLGIEISFAQKNFKWSNNASHNAAVICSIIGLAKKNTKKKVIIENELSRKVDLIGPYLIPGNDTVILQTLSPISDLNPIITGNSPYDGGNLILSSEEKANLEREQPDVYRLIKRLYGSQDYLNGGQRFCLWIDDDNLAFAESIQSVQRRIDKVKAFRKAGGEVAKGLAKRSHQFRYTHQANKHLIIAPRVSSERRKYSIWLTFK